MGRKKSKRGRPKKNKGLTIDSPETKITIGIVISLLGLFCLLSHALQGDIFDFINRIFGIGAYPAGILLIILGMTIAGLQIEINTPKRIIGITSLTVILSTVAHFVIPEDIVKDMAQKGKGGGFLGLYTSQFIIDMFGRIAGIIVIIVFLFFTLILVSGLKLKQIKELFSKVSKKDIKINTANKDKDEKKEDEDELTNQYIGDISQKEKSKKLVTEDESEEVDEPKNKDKQEEALEYLTEDEDESSEENESDSEDEEKTKEDIIKYPNWKFPDLSMLNPGEKHETDPEVHKKKTEIIEKTLKSFGIQAKVVEISVGPRVVQYALSITVGTKVSKVKSLGNDLALALAAPTGSVRIEAPIPGTSLIGIEVPNDNPAIVTLGEVLQTKTWQDFDGRLPLAFGRDVSGKVIVKDLTKMPHMLIAGATGSGKSVCVNAFLCSLLSKLSPDELKLILVDPKMVELPPYNGIPHLLTPVITDVERVVHSLEWMVTEMQKRFKILNKAGKRNIHQYNNSMGFPALPYIVLVVDEMADLMLTTGVDVESKIVRLAQMARAVGIHLILATQRPSVDVLTGLIKANVPARVSFNVATTVDSRVILDIAGAETLLGDGDMLFKAPDLSRPFRIQGAWIKNEEITKVTKFLKDQADEVEYNEDVTKPQQEAEAEKTGLSQISEDDLVTDAIKLVTKRQKASASMLQRKLRIGYNRAARLLDELHEAKIVGPPNGSKPRKVFISDADSFIKKLKEKDQESE